MPQINHVWKQIAGINGFTGVMMGAIAAHIILDPQLAAMAEKASLYHIVHSVLLFTIASEKSTSSRVVRWLLLISIALFCGSLYIRALSGWAEGSFFAPIGGLGLLMSWLLIAWRGLR